MRKITVTLNGIEQPPRRREPHGAAAFLIGLGVVVFAFLRTRSPVVNPVNTNTNTAPVTTTSPPPAPAALSVDQTELRFTGPSTQAVRVRNTGELPLTIEQPAVSGTSFHITSECKSPLRKNESCVVSVALDPNVPLDLNGTDQLRIASNGGSATITLIANITPTPTIELPPLKFGQRLLNATGAALAVEFINSGPIAIALGSASTTAPFKVWNDTCEQKQIDPGKGCQVFVAFNPTTAGSHTGELQMSSADGKLVAHAALSGEAITLSLPAADFSRQPVGQPGKPRPVTLTNTTTSSLVVGAASTGPPFRIVRDGCGNTSLPPAGGCTVLADFLPTAEGQQNGELRITAADGAVIARGSLTGFGFTQQIPVKIDIEPRTISFADNGTRPVVLSNRGAAPVTIGVNFEALTIGYSLDASGCTSTPLPPGQQCKIVVTATRFAPRTGPARISIRYAGRVEFVTVSWAAPVLR